MEDRLVETSNGLQTKMDGEDFKETSGFTSTDPTNGNSVDQSGRILHLGKYDGENRGINLQQTFKEENLVSLFTFDCPPATASVPYRVLHRLDLNFCDSCDAEEEGFFSVEKETNKSKKINVSQLLSSYSPRDNINILRLLLESRYAIPICNLEIVELLRITQRIEDDVFLGEDLKLPRIALISKVKNFESHTGKIMEGLFNLRTSFNPSDASNIEIGQGLVCLGNKKKEACIVIHIWGKFEQYWNSLTDFVDYLIVEDEYKSESDRVDNVLVGNEISSQLGKLSPFIRKYSGETSLPKFITVWIPNFSNMKNVSIVRPFCLIEGSLSYFVEIQQRRQLLSIFREATSHEKSLHSLFSFNGHLRKEMDILREMYLTVSQMNGLEEYRTKFLLLQKSYAKEGAFLEQLNEVKSIGEKNERNEIQQKIIEEHEFRFSRRSKTDPLIMYFLEGLRKSNIDEMVLHLQVFDDAIANNIKKSKIVAQLAEEVGDKTTKFSQRLQLSVTDPEYVKQVELSRKELTVAKENRNNAVLSLRHLWREISLFYSSGNSGEFEDLPQRAAFYLIGGETLELYDGDANMLNVEWIATIFKNLESLLPQKRIFVLSVLGEQSSGKSTLLNTMFGIRLPASVGQCTRGLTITLVKTIERQEYDYVLIFDSEGLRSPEHKGLCGSIKRDNKIATLSVLPSDATILVIKGENDNALKDILPIVALAYKGSKLAEEREGILSCKFFAAYNQVKADGENKKKLQNIFSQLSTTLVESFAKTNSLSDLDVHTSIKFPQLLTNEQDIWVFGCNSKGDSPLDVPNTDFSQQMVEFREYIHNQVVKQLGWNAREFGNLEQYLTLVWDCLSNSDFDLSFETVIERHAYTELENKYQNVRKKYYEEYEEQFNLLKDKYKEDYSLQEGRPMKFTEIHANVEELEVKMKPQSEKFEEYVNLMFEEKHNQKWKTEFLRKVQDTIFSTTIQWCHKLEVFLRNQFTFGAKVKQYEREMRDEIAEEFRTGNMKEKTEEQLIEMFNRIFDNIVKRAKEENPPMDVQNAVLKAYRTNSTIASLGIDLLCDNEKTSLWGKLWNGSKNKAKNLIDSVVEWLAHGQTDKNPIEKMVIPMVVRAANGRKFYCDAVVHNTINDIETFIRRQNKKMNKWERKQIHRAAYDLLTNIFLDIQLKWEQENSVYMRFKSMKMAMQRYCLNVAKGLEKVDLIASILEEFFSKHTVKAYESEVVETVMTNLRKKCWPQSPKYVQGHMDLYLIDEIEPKGIDEVISMLNRPRYLKKLTTKRLIRFEIEIVLEHLKWDTFKSKLEGCLENTYSTSVNVESGSFQFNQLLKSFQIFASKYIADELKNEMNALGWTGLEQMSIEFEARHINGIINKFTAVIFSVDKEKVINSILLQLQDNRLFAAAFCTSCVEQCHLCRSFCILEISHDGCHDCFHQPRGLRGAKYRETRKLSQNACNTMPPRHQFILENDEEWMYADYSKKFDTWLQPDRTQLVSEYRQYLISRYNEEIAKYYSVNPSDTVDPAESLDVVTSKIKRRLDFFKDFPQH